MRTWAGLAATLALSLAWACGPGPREPSGPELARRLECFACHALQGQGGNEASPLDGVGARLSSVELQISLTHPRRRHPGAKMPSFAYLRPEERQALLDFLAALK